MSDDEFNKECAEALGNYDEAYGSSEMEFHDSYDWAYLLVAECIKRNLSSQLHDALDAIVYNGFIFECKAREISQACLEALRD